MSFLNDIRIVFNGRFQADVSTVNNDVRHFDNSTFEASFQEFQSKSGAWNGWWNPPGSGAFRLLDCRVVAAHYRDGTSAARDPVLGLSIAGSEDQTSGKLVDIDPQWQLASTPWGFFVRLTDGAAPDVFAGSYTSHAFRDLWFGRMLAANGQPGGGDGFASAIFQSVLTEVQWAGNLRNSHALAELKAASAATGVLSIRMTTFGYSDRNPAAGDFTTGTVVGVIGPALPGEPESYIAGRRFAPANGTTSWNGCGYFNGHLDRQARRLFLDLGNAIQLAFPNQDPTQGPLVPVGTLNDIGDLQVGILRDLSAAEFTPATRDNFVPIGRIDYRQPGWLLATGGVVALPLDDDQLSLIESHPLALAAAAELNAGTGITGEFGQIAIRETADGLFVEAEPIVHRIDAPGSSSAIIRATRYGVPQAGATIATTQAGRMPNQGSGDPNAEVTTTIPDIGLPASALQLPPTVTTSADGTATMVLNASDPGNPRKYIDGQIYLVDFRVPGQGNQARSPFDYIVVHVRDAFVGPQEPQWADIAPIMTQYANLYPVMSRGLFDLAQQAVVERHAKVLRLAFSRPIGDANHMPVTRDLSAGKREMILRYLDAVISREQATTPAATLAPTAPPALPERPQEPIDHLGGKTAAARQFARATGRPDVT
jgi:hypothetical protein